MRKYALAPLFPVRRGEKMLSELRKIVQNIQENTGIAVSVYSAEGRPLAGAGKSISPEFEGILQDEKGNVTCFKITYRSTPYICSVEGAGPVQKNYAYLLADILENAAGRAANLPKAEFLRRILLGECSASDIQKFRARYPVPDTPCFVLAVAAEGKTSDAISLLSQYAENEADCAVVVSGKDCAFVKFVSEDSEYQSSADFASFLARSLMEELGMRAHIGVGGTFRRFEDAGGSYRQASAALRMSTMFNSKGVVHSYREFMLIKMLEDIPENKLSEYLSVLLDGDAKELLKDEDMVNTAEEFLENSLNVSETSRNLYMHRNTLMYRLDKIERVTGLNLRKFSDAVTFRLITILNKLV